MTFTFTRFQITFVEASFLQLYSWFLDLRNIKTITCKYSDHKTMFICRIQAPKSWRNRKWLWIYRIQLLWPRHRTPSRSSLCLLDSEPTWSCRDGWRPVPQLWVRGTLEGCSLWGSPCHCLVEPSYNSPIASSSARRSNHEESTAHVYLWIVKFFFV